MTLQVVPWLWIPDKMKPDLLLPSIEDIHAWTCSGLVKRVIVAAGKNLTYPDQYGRLQIVCRGDVRIIPALVANTWVGNDGLLNRDGWVALVADANARMEQCRTDTVLLDLEGAWWSCLGGSEKPPPAYLADALFLDAHGDGQAADALPLPTWEQLREALEPLRGLTASRVILYPSIYSGEAGRNSLMLVSAFLATLGRERTTLVDHTMQGPDWPGGAVRRELQATIAAPWHPIMQVWPGPSGIYWQTGREAEAFATYKAHGVEQVYYHSNLGTGTASACVQRVAGALSVPELGGDVSAPQGNGTTG